MKKFPILLSLVLSLVSLSCYALDPLAPRGQRAQGMIFVKTPNSSDSVTLTNKNTGSSEALKPESLQWVAVGDYTVSAKMQDYNYNQNVTVQPTERTDVVVPGFGNLQVNSISPQDTIEVFKIKGGALAAKFPASQVKTLPEGRYNVKVTVGKQSVTKDNVLIVTNTTRQVDVSYKMDVK